MPRIFVTYVLTLAGGLVSCVVECPWTNDELALPMSAGFLLVVGGPVLHLVYRNATPCTQPR